MPTDMPSAGNSADIGLVSLVWQLDAANCLVYMSYAIGAEYVAMGGQALADQRRSMVKETCIQISIKHLGP